MSNFQLLVILVFCVLGIVLVMIGFFQKDFNFIVFGICLVVLWTCYLIKHIDEISQKNKEAADVSSTEIFEHSILFEPYITDNTNIVTFDGLPPGFLKLKPNQIGMFYCTFFDNNETPVPTILDFKFSVIESKEYFNIDIFQCEDGRNLVTVYPLKKDSMQAIFLYSKNQMYAAEVLLATGEATNGNS